MPTLSPAKVKLMVAYPYVLCKNCYGYVTVNSQYSSYGEPGCRTSVRMPFPVGTKTLEWGAAVDSILGIDSLDFLPGKKLFGDYSKIKLKLTETMPGKEEVIVIDKSKQMNEYLSYLFDTYSYLRVTKDASLTGIISNYKSVKASLNIYRAKDVLPMEYQCEDCVVVLLKANDHTQMLVLSNVTGLLDIDGEEFERMPYTKSDARDFFNSVFSAVKKLPTVKKEKEASAETAAVYTYGGIKLSPEDLSIEDTSSIWNPSGSNDENKPYVPSYEVVNGPNGMKYAVSTNTSHQTSDEVHVDWFKENPEEE